jgi:hypothetical protein
VTKDKDFSLLIHDTANKRAIHLNGTLSSMGHGAGHVKDPVEFAM